MKNTCKRNFLISLALVIVGSGMLIYSGARAFSYEANTAYTEFYFTGDFGVGDADLPIFNVDGTDGGATGDFSFGLKNLSSTEALSGKFSFVDAVTLIAGTNVYGCKGEKDSTFFSSDITVSPNPFVLNTGSTATYTANFDFNQKVSGTYTGCVVYTPDGTIQDGIADAVPRKALIFAVNLTGTNPSHPVSIVVNPGSRWDIPTRNPYAHSYESSGYIVLSGCDNGLLYTGLVSVGSTGYALLDFTVNNGCYDVVYKGWHHLAAYYSGLQIDGDGSISFTSGDNLSGLTNFNVNGELIEYNNGNLYLIAGELPDGDGVYNGEINGGDFSILRGPRCKYNMGTENNVEICDLNHDGQVDSSDVSVILPIINDGVNDKSFINQLTQKYSTASTFYNN